jgi:hypothetical protein
MNGGPRLVLQQQTSTWVAPKEKPTADSSPSTTPRKKNSPLRSPRGCKKFVPPEPPSQIAFFVATSPREQLSAAKEALRATNVAARFSHAMHDELSSFEKRHGFDELTLQLAENHQSAPQTDTSSLPLPGRLVPLISNNPLSGLLCNVPTYDFYKAFKTVSAKHRAKSLFAFNTGGSQKREPLKMSLEDFETMLKSLVPQVSLSAGYLEHMLEPFEISQVYGTSHRVVNFVDVFSFLARCSGSATIEANLSFFMKALDPTKRGYLPTPLLCGRLLRSWCENRVVGGALLNWRKLCRAFDVYGDIDTKLLESAAVVTHNELRVIVASNKELIEAFSAELECQLTPGPRFVSSDSGGAHSQPPVSTNPAPPTLAGKNGSEGK